MLLFYQLLITKTTAEELVSEASNEAPLTRKIGLNLWRNPDELPNTLSVLI